MSRTRVVVTGLGTTSPLGGDVASTWEGLLAGRSGVRHLGDVAEGLPVTIGGVAAVDPTEVLDRVVARRLDRSSQLALVAALEAWADSGLDTVQEAGDLDSERFGVAFASGIGGVQTLLSNHEVLHREGSAPGLPHRRPDADGQRPGGQPSASSSSARGPVNTPVSACASGNEAIALAADHDPARPGRRAPSPAAPRRRSTRCRSPRSPT